MDVHCYWINNCVGLGNHKYYLNFLVHTFLLCAVTLLLLTDSLYTLLIVKGMARNTWNLKWFWPAVSGCLLTAYLSAYFMGHLKALIQE